ncbi:MAG: glutamine synthetase [Solirubrobacterales bacterium]|nr:glutamine synthetase [Solirubrobacterales bacterium]
MAGESATVADAESQVEQLAGAGVAGVTIVWADNNGIPRSRTVPIARLAEVAKRGVGITSLFAVFTSHDGITFEHEGLSTPSGDVRLLPVLERLRPLAGQPGFAWVPGRQLGADGSPWPYDQRAALEAQVQRAEQLGLQFRIGYELEFFVAVGQEGLEPAHPGPAYSPHALLAIDEFVAQLLVDLEANGLEVNQLHAEYGPAQVELSLAASDPVSAADNQLLARQTIRAAARTHDLRVSFAPLINAENVGNGWHIHSSVWRGGENLLAGDSGPGPEGAAFIAGLLRDLPALAAVTVPSVPSLARLRPGYFASAYIFWGVENREAALRYVPSSQLLGASHANVELKPSDASANPYLALAALIAAGVAGIEERLTPPAPIEQDPGGWSEAERQRVGILHLPATPAEQEQALLANPRIKAALGEPLLGAFTAVRRADAAWAAERTPDEVIAAHLWLY